MSIHKVLVFRLNTQILNAILGRRIDLQVFMHACCSFTALLVSTDHRIEASEALVHANTVRDLWTKCNFYIYINRPCSAHVSVEW